MKNEDAATHFWESAKYVWTTGANEISRLHECVQKEDFIHVMNMLADCRGKIVISGVGTSGTAAKKISHSLCCIERPSFFLDPGDAVHGGLGAVQEEDVVILISKGGGTGELVTLIPAFRSKKVSIIGVTENTDSIIGRESDVCLKVKIVREADSFNMLATTSTMAVVAVFDALCISLMELTGFTKEKFAVIHPGGEVGRRLLKSKK